MRWPVGGESDAGNNYQIDHVHGNRLAGNRLADAVAGGGEARRRVEISTGSIRRWSQLTLERHRFPLLPALEGQRGGVHFLRRAEVKHDHMSPGKFRGGAEQVARRDALLMQFRLAQRIEDFAQFLPNDSLALPISTHYVGSHSLVCISRATSTRGC